MNEMLRVAQATDTKTGRKGGFSQFDWADPFHLDTQLTEDERAIRDAAHAYCQDKLFPRVLQAFRHESFDREIVSEMGEMGVSRGDAFGSWLRRCVLCRLRLIARELERVDSGYRSVFSVQSSLVMYPIDAFGSPAQKDNTCLSCGRANGWAVSG
jgi:Acyl-CoA dehydrogenase, N-terminal domain.